MNLSKYTKSCLFAVAVLTSTQAGAADEGGYSWSGLYVGVNAGASFGSGNLKDEFCDGVTPGNCVENDATSPNFGLPGTYIGKLKSTSFVGGVHVGYNHQFSNGLVIGAESEIGRGGKFKGKFHYGENFGYTNAINEDDTGEVRLGLTGSARTRVGFAVDRWLPFVTAGVAFAKFKATDKDPTNSDKPRFANGSFIGFTAGAGVNYAMTDHLIIGAEYRFTNFGKTNIGLVNPAIDNDSWKFSTKLRTHDLRLSASFKF